MERLAGGCVSTASLTYEPLPLTHRSLYTSTYGREPFVSFILNTLLSLDPQPLLALFSLGMILEDCV